jgi:Domain of unknown function (DUF4397)
MLRWLKALPLALPLTLALAALGFLVACGSGNSVQVRFVHAIQDSGQLDIDFNGTKEYTDIAFTAVQPSSGYSAVPAGNDTIQGFATGTTTLAFTNSNVNLNAGTEYTVVATGFITSTSDVVILSPADTNTEPANGTVNFRVIDASPSGPGSLDIYILPNPVVGGIVPPATISGLAYQQTSTYVPLPYNSNGQGYTIYVCTSGSTNPIFSQPLTVGSSSEGSIRTLILTDQANDDALRDLFTVLNDLN